MAAVTQNAMKKVRKILAENVSRRIDEQFPLSLSTYRSPTAQRLAVARKASVSLRTLNEILHGTRSTGVDHIERLARALGCQPHELLLPPGRSKD